MLRKLLALCVVAKLQIQMAFVYRLNYLFGIISLFLPVAASYFIWTGVYSSGTVDTGYDLQSILLYSVIGVGLRLSTSTNVITLFEGLVNSGNIALELLKPISLQAKILFTTIGDVIQGLLTKFFVVFLLAVFIFRLDILFIQPINILYFVALMLLGFFIVFLIDYLIGLISFWLTQLWGINFAKRQMMSVLSGSLIPLTMYPTALVTVLNYTPFPYIYGYPLDALIMGITSERFLEIVIIDLIWIIGLFVLSRIVWFFGSKKVFVQGG
ncbi:MAG: ABC-2 family transporter protein [Clostridia bacterium]